MITTLITAALEGAINRYLALDPEGLQRLLVLQGKIVQIEISDWHQQIQFIITANKVRLSRQTDNPADVVISGTMLALIQNLRTEEADVQTWSQISVTGNVELGRYLRQTLAQLRVDWEGLLAGVVGDTVARPVGNAARHLYDWTKNSSTRLQQQVTDYLQEEARLLPPRQEVEDFYNDIGELRNDVARVEARIAMLVKEDGNK